jgi:hypothetical protein
MAKQKLKVQSATVKVNGRTYKDGDEIELDVVESPKDDEPTQLTEQQYEQLLASGTVLHPDDEGYDNPEEVEEDPTAAQKKEDTERAKVSGATADPDSSTSTKSSTKSSTKKGSSS